MVSLSHPQQKILSVIDKNARLSYSEIGKRANLPKSVVNYNFNILLDNGIIKGFATLIDPSALGFTELRVYLNLYERDLQQEKDFLIYLQSCHNSGIVIKCVGDFDLVVSFYTKDLRTFWNEWFETLKQFRKIIKSYFFSFVVEKKLFPFFSENDLRIKYSFLIGNKKEVSYDNIDKNILDILSKDCRKPIYEIATSVNLKSSSLIYRIKKLESQGIICGYYTIFNFSKMAKEFCRVHLQIEEMDLLPRLLDHLKVLPKVISITKTLGAFSDLEIDLLVNNINDLLLFITKLREKFPGLIRDYNHVRVINTLKWNHYPNL
ncbi:hypothetical protein COY27_02885 [Candidatus Woesearchaeota archaeon CG_4_10_14_0_2_um_filter_33_13]|nr:MAG: hypothetical protein COY27_02885 [Candidatus Woesearchaeota archaeon CG_4_10_14_0_2_um_filter_33_13]